MSNYDNTNNGALFRNDKRGDNEKAPHAKGTLNVNGVDFWISAWTKTDKNGNKYQSLSVQPKEAQAPKPKANPEPDYSAYADDAPF